MNDLIKLAIWAVVIGVLFAILWRKGVLLRISGYFMETREELKKCSWPSPTELKGSTVVVMVTVGILGIFTVITDFFISQFIRFIT